jgi:acyl phosphate:glycerol-3-phosphate acyltransferase
MSWLDRFPANPTLPPRELVVMLACYALGSFTAGYYLVRFRTGEDVRQLGSGSVGAKNVGRCLGGSAFLITFLLDFVKGVVAVWAAFEFKLSPWGVVFAMIAVVAGHIWPVQLRFQGGKGISTSAGAVLIYDPFIASVLGLLFLLFYALIRNFVLGGLLAFAMAPFCIFALGWPVQSVVGLSFLAVIILCSHRRNIAEEIGRSRSRGTPEGN